jgi:ketosteroid isomerase-like protein
MWKLISIVLLSLLGPRQFAAQSAPQPNAGQARILTLENAWNQATLQKDATALDLLLAPDLTYVKHDGTLMNKAEYVASVQSPALHLARIVSETMNVHLYGEVAVVTGSYRENGVRDGKPYTQRGRFTDTWVLRSSTWLCVASQSTLILY